MAVVSLDLILQSYLKLSLLAVSAPLLISVSTSQSPQHSVDRCVYLFMQSTVVIAEFSPLQYVCVDD